MSKLINAPLQRKLKSSRYWSRIGIIVGFLLLMTLLIPRSYRLGVQYEVGKPWFGGELTAPFDFYIYKSQDSIAAEQEAYTSQVSDIYRRDTLRMRQTYQALDQKLSDFVREVNQVQSATSRLEDQGEEMLMQAFQTKYPGVEYGSFSGLSRGRIARLQAETRSLAQDIYEQGYLNQVNVADTPAFVSLRVKPGLEREVPVRATINSQLGLESYLARRLDTLDSEGKLLWLVVSKNLRPNYYFSSRLTEEAREWKRSLVSPIFGKVSKGEHIIGKDEIVTRDTYAKLVSLEREKRRTYGGQSWFLVFLGQFLIITFITLILLSNLSVTRPRIFFSNSKLSLILFTLLLAVALMVIATKLTDVAVKLTDILGPNINLSYIYLAPACIVPIFISSFFEHRLGFLTNMLVALYGAVLVQQGLEYAFVQMMAGTVAVYNLRRLRKRERFFYTLGYIFLAYSVSYIVFNLLSKGGFGEISYHTLMLFAINVSVTMIAYNLIYLLERVFGETSDLTYLELLDTNHPLLQELARKAPGTFQHSLQVANIAELTINEVGGNALLVHVGALYHDIGKMPYAHYFIENMSDAEKKKNPHHRIDCLESAEIIIGHVKYGVELAQKYHLPREIIHFIESHHGTTRVEYFYRVYVQENNCVESEADNLFRYPGPLPFSKETAVLMIADSVEAASRAMKNPTSSKLKELVDSIIDHKIKDGQLENSNLTFKDITNMRRVIKKQLLSIYHGRIEYPEDEQEEVKA